nr:TPM domain-containing protein [Petrachloros mirabilis]
MILVLIASLVLGIAPALATGLQDLPIVAAGTDTWVIDQGEVLSLLTESSLANKLSSLASETGQEVRMITTRRLDYGETPSSLSDELFAEWFPTPEAQANQTLLLLDTKTNTTAIRTGNQAKTLLPDDIADSIATETTLVPIRKGNYNQGLLDASNRLATVLSGQPDPGPPIIAAAKAESTFTSAEETDDRSATYIVVGLLILATVIPMVTYYMYQGS